MLYYPHMRHYIALAIAVTIFTVPWFATYFPDQADRLVVAIRSAGSQLAAVIIHNPRTVAGLQEKYNKGVLANNVAGPQNKIRILIVPGHEPGYGGAEFGNVKERELTVELAVDLAKFLKENGRYEVIVTRNDDTWNPVFADHFKNNWDAIIQWKKDHRVDFLKQTSAKPAPINNKPKIYHNSAPDDVAYRLFGITKWSNENAADIAIHIHFNDYPGHTGSGPGKYTGFAIYTPESQYANSTTTRAVSESIFKRLQKYNPVSDFPGEANGIVEEGQLIAIGVNNTADAASLLIEYGYIYEQQFTDPDARGLALSDLAFQTYLGLEDFFNPRGSSVLAAMYDTLVLPHNWTSTISGSSKSTKDVYALQTALLVDGVYPPQDRSLNDCPRTGTIGPCTESAVQAFQKKYGIRENGVGTRTVEELNKMYGLRAI